MIKFENLKPGDSQKMFYEQDYVKQPENNFSEEFFSDLRYARIEALGFLEKFKNLDVSKEGWKDILQQAYDSFESIGLFKQAKKIRKAIHGDTITTYGVVYKGDTCISSCTFCPAHKPSADETRTYFPRELDAEDVVNEVLAALLQGHTEVCLLQGDVSEEVFLRKANEWLPEIVSVCGYLGLNRLVLNVQTLSSEGYAKLKQLLDESNEKYYNSVAFNIRTFQETYDCSAYTAVIPKPLDNTRLGEKWNFSRRRATQETACTAGIEGVGMGLLVGISPKPLKDLLYLIAHQQQLLRDGINVERVAIPSAHNIEGLNTHVPYDLGYGEEYQKLMETLYALFRILADPSVSLVMSERDSQELLKKLAEYADHTTVGVHPEVGGNLKALLIKQFSAPSPAELEFLTEDPGSKLAKQILGKLKPNKDLPVFTQANVSSVLPSVFIKEMGNIGFTVQLSRDEIHLNRIKAELSKRLKIPITIDDF